LRGLVAAFEGDASRIGKGRRDQRSIHSAADKVGILAQTLDAVNRPKNWKTAVYWMKPAGDRISEKFR